MTTHANAFPLEGIRVLDLSRVLSGPFAGRMLADLGADVLKVEPPEGDTSRYWGAVQDGISGFFLQQNAGKRCLSLNLKAPGAASLILRLVAATDIVLENFRPGVLARLGIGYEEMRSVNSRILLLSITGFGQDGPDAQRAAYAPVIHAESGLMWRQAQFDQAPITDLMLAIGDTLAGLHGLVATLAALHLRERTGIGQHIDIAMFDSMLATDEYAHHALDESVVRRARSDVWDTPDGPILLAGDFKWLWYQLSRVHGLSDGLPAEATVDEKVTARRIAVARWVASYTGRDSLLGALDKAGIASAVPQDSAAAFSTEQARYRECATVVGDSTRRIVQSPYRFSAARSGVRGTAGRFGEHNESALRDWLGFGPDDVAALTAEGVIVATPHPSAS